MIVDAGVHVWRAEVPSRPWPPGREEPQRAEPFEVDELLQIMDAHGVHRAVIVPPIWVGEDNTDVLEWAAQHPDRLAVMGRHPFTPETAARLDTWRDQPGMLGIRLSYPAGEFGDWLDADRNRWFWSKAAAARLPLFVLCQNQAARLAPIAERYPELPLIVDHLALRNIRLDRLAGRESDAFERFEDLLALSRFPNVSVKFSSLPTYSNERFPFEDLKGGLARAVEAFGSERIMWASDLTRMELLEHTPSYDEILGHVRDELDFLIAKEREDILGRTALRVLGWPSD